MSISAEPLAKNCWAVRSGPNHGPGWTVKTPYDACGVARRGGDELIIGPWVGPIPPAEDVMDLLLELGCKVIKWNRLKPDGSTITLMRTLKESCDVG